MGHARPPGFGADEWRDAIASGRVILVAPPPVRRAWWSRLPRPLAGVLWLIARGVRARLAVAGGPRGDGSTGVCAPASGRDAGTGPR